MSAVRYHPPVKYSVVIAGHRTSISLEPLFWEMLGEAASRKGSSINSLVAEIDAARIRSATPPGLASAIRLWLMTRAENGENDSTALSPTAMSNPAKTSS